MSIKHGFFIPDAEYCSDVPALLAYLGTKVGCGNVCIRCNEKSKRFRNLESCQKHMRDKAHCFFTIDGEDITEYLDFYDYGDLLTDNADENADDTLIDTGDSLILPSGAKIGHRSLMRYYRQSLKPLDHPMNQPRGRNVFQLMGGHYKALGWTGVTGQAAVQRARDVKVIKHVMDKYRLRQGTNANKLFKTRGRKDQL
jgi:pre-60S factor REI1